MNSKLFKGLMALALIAQISSVSAGEDTSATSVDVPTPVLSPSPSAGSADAAEPEETDEGDYGDYAGDDEDF